MDSSRNNIHQLMHMAATNWEIIAKHLDLLLDVSYPNDFSIDDKTFSEFKNVLWVIGKLDEIAPMVRDSLDQWEWFRVGNSRLRTTTQETLFTELQHMDDDDSEE